MSYTQNRQYPFIRLSIALIIGIAVYPDDFDWSAHGVLYFGVVLFCLVLLGLSTPAIKGFAILVLIGTMGIFRMGISQLAINHGNFGKGPSRVIAQIESIQNNRITLRVRQNNNNHYKRKCIVVVDSLGIEFLPGDLVYFSTFWQRIPPNRNPFSFNPQKFYASQNIFWQCFLAENEILHLKASHFNALFTTNRKLQQKIDETFLPESAVLSKALLTGNRLPPKSTIRQLFQSTGHMHLLAVSGLHIGLLFILVQRLFSPMKGFKWGQWVIYFLTILVIWTFAIFSGAKASAIRAAFMFTVFATTNLSMRPVRPFNILGLVAFVLLIYNPYLIWDIGFQLSFLAMSGILLLHKPILTIYQPRHTVFKGLYQIVVLSFCAVLFTAPVVVHYFGVITVSSIIYSPITISLTSMLLPLLFIWLVAHSIPILSDWIIFLIENLSSGLFTTLEFFDQQFNVQIEWFPMNLIQITFLYILLLLFAYIIINRNFTSIKLAFVGCISILLAERALEIIKADKVQVILYDSRKSLLMDIFHGDSCMVITDDSTDMELAVPYRNHISAKSVKVLPDDYQNDFMYRKGNFFQIKDTKFAITNQLENSHFPQVDYLIIKGAPNEVTQWAKPNTNLIIHRDNPFSSFQGKGIHNMWKNYSWKRRF